MPPDDKQKTELPDNGRKNLGFEELGKKAAFATGGAIMIGKVAEAAAKRAVKVSENLAEQKQKNQIQDAGQKVIGAQAVDVAEQTVEAEKQQIENTAKDTYNRMLQRHAEREQKNAQKKKVTVKSSKKSSVVTDVATSVLKPSIMPEFFLPGAKFLKEAITKIL